MKQLIVGKLLFASQLGYYGLELCLKDSPHIHVNVDEKTAWGCDIILTSLFFYKDVLHLEKFLRVSGMKNNPNRPLIIAGGLQATVTPELIAEMVDYVFIGDGEEHLANILNQYAETGIIENPYLYKKAQAQIPNPCEAKEINPIAYENATYRKLTKEAKIKRRKIQQNRSDRAVRGKITRIEIARGCKYKCPFCLMSGLKPYREADVNKVVALLDAIPNNTRVSCFAPDRLAHSGYDQIQAKIKEKSLKHFGTDVRLENLLQDDNENVVIGIEGLSERLRKTINKNYKEDYILSQIETFMNTGSRRLYGASITLYYIADLPTECEADFDEVEGFIRRLNEVKNINRATIFLCLNPLSPKPFTQLYNAEIHPFKNYATRWTKLMRGGDGASRWNFKTIENRVWNCLERTIDAIIHQGGSLAYKIIGDLSMPLLSKTPFDWQKAELLSRRILRQCNGIGLTEQKLFSSK